MDRTYYIYMLTNDSHASIYTGITNDLRRRMLEHKNKIVPGFTEKYNVHKLIYVETFSYVKDAIQREKQIKKYSRAKKKKLIEDYNPLWEDLSYKLNS